MSSKTPERIQWCGAPMGRGAYARMPLHRERWGGILSTARRQILCCRISGLIEKATRMVERSTRLDSRKVFECGQVRRRSGLDSARNRARYLAKNRQDTGAHIARG